MSLTHVSSVSRSWSCSCSSFRPGPSGLSCLHSSTTIHMRQPLHLAARERQSIPLTSSLDLRPMSSCRPLLFIAALLVAGPPFLGLGLGKLANAKVSVSDEKTGEKLDAPCSKGCKAAYIGDKNCDMECYNEECDFDGGDCEPRTPRAVRRAGQGLTL